MTPEQFRAWIGTPAATRLINQLWPDSVMVCATPSCGELAAAGSLCASCEAFDRELAAIRQRAANDAIYTRYVRSDAWKAS